MLLYILEENIFFFINHCGVTTCGQTDQEPVKLSKVSKVSKVSIIYLLSKSDVIEITRTHSMAMMISDGLN